jgi:HSP20 family protein
VTLMRFDPEQALATTRRQAARFWSSPWAMTSEFFGDHVWPAIDLYEEGDGLVLEAELPGVAPEDLDLTVEPTTLRIAGMRRHRLSSGHAEERFRRTVPLPFPIDPETARGELRDGLLHMEMERKDSGLSRRIPVAVRESARAR